MVGNLNSSIIEYMSEGMLTINGYGVIVSANEAAERILTVEKGGLVGKRFGLIFSVSEYNDGFVQLIIDSMLDSENVHSETVTFDSAEGVKYLKTVAKSHIYVEDESKNALSVTVCFQDVTDFVTKNNIKDEIKAINKVNKALKKRNLLIRKIFGCFILRQNEDTNLITSDLVNQLNRGALKDVTIVQSDLRGYTAISNRMESGNMAVMMNHYIDEMSEAVFLHHGSIVEFYGDGIVSVFGAFGHEDTQCEDAIAAAVEMEKRMAGVNKWNFAHGFKEYFRMGIGIDRGEAILGFVGRDKLRTFDVMGEVVGRADEIQSNTVEGQILISEKVRKCVKCELKISKTLNLYLPHCGENETASLVSGIGKPYNLSLEARTEKRKKLSEPVELEIFIIDGKVRDEASISVSLLEISESELVVVSARDLNPLDNIEFYAGGRAYAKITDKREDTYTLAVTNLPPEFSDWKNKLNFLA